MQEKIPTLTYPVTQIKIPLSDTSTHKSLTSPTTTNGIITVSQPEKKKVKTYTRSNSVSSIGYNKTELAFKSTQEIFSDKGTLPNIFK